MTKGMSEEGSTMSEDYVDARDEPGGKNHVADQHASTSILDARFPPVAELVVASVAMMLAGGIYLAAHLPVPPPLGPAVGLLIAGGVLTLAALALLARIRPFAWGKFFLVWRWALLAYLVIAGMLAYVFIFDHTRGDTLVVLLITLFVFALDVPTVIAFTVARYDEGSLPAKR